MPEAKRIFGVRGKQKDQSNDPPEIYYFLLSLRSSRIDQNGDVPLYLLNIILQGDCLFSTGKRYWCLCGPSHGRGKQQEDLIFPNRS